MQAKNQSVPSISGKIREDQHFAHSTTAMNTTLPLASFTPSAVIGHIEVPVYTAASHNYLDPNAPTLVNSYDNYASRICGSPRVSRAFRNTEYNDVGQIRGRTSGDPNLAIVHIHWRR